MPRQFFFAAVLILMTASAYGQTPVISSFSPTSGPIGTIVTINGANFSAVPAGNIVYFGGVRANVSASATGTMTVTVPKGAGSQPITVTANNLTAASTGVFTTIFSGGSPDLVSSSFAPGARLNTGLFPFSVCVVDLDGDGNPDLVTPDNANSPSSNISWLRNTGGGVTLSFAPNVDLPAPAGSFPYSMVAADLDGDGKQDIIFSSSIGSLSVYRNTSTPGNISFAARLDYATGKDPFSVAAADLDGDGKPDLAVANYLSNTVSVFKNTSFPGTITFEPKTDLTTALAPQTVAIGDLDGDSKPDLAVTNAFSSSVSLFRNQSIQGALSFATRTDVATASDEPFGLAIGDLDGDGKPDLVVTYSNANKVNEAAVSFSTFRNNSSPGAFAFAAPVNRGTGDSYNPAIGDLNGDGRPDLVIPTRDNYIFVYPNLSTPPNIGLGTPGKYNDPFSYFAAINDLDGDNIPDIAVADFTSNTITFFKNNTVAPGIASVSPSTAGIGTVVTITGVNLGDLTSVSFGGTPATSFTVISPSAIRAVVGAGASGDVSVTSLKGTGTWSGFTYIPPAAITAISPSTAGKGTMITIHGSMLGQTTAVSFGGVPATLFTIVSDSIVTAVVGAGASGDVVLTSPVNTTTLPAAFTFIPAPSINAFSPSAAASGESITIAGTNFTNTTAVTFGGTPALSFIVNNPTSITAMVGGGSVGAVGVTTPGGTATLDGFSYTAKTPPSFTSFAPTSGKIGTPVTISGSGFDPMPANNIVYFGSTRATVTAASATTLTVTVPAGASLQPVSVTPLSRNLTTWSTKPFIVTFDSGAMTFAYPLDFVEAGYLNHSISAGDLDGDGKADLVLATDDATFSPENVAIAFSFDVLRNTSPAIGTISFAPKQLIASAVGNNAASFTDVDGDGKPDLVIPGYDTIAVYRNTSSPGNISFTGPIKFITGLNSRDIAVADLDNDGRPDLTIVDTAFNSIVVLRNTSIPGTISFTGKTSYRAGGLYSGFSGVAVSDLNGDGKNDIVVTCQNENKVCVLANNSTPGILSFATPLSYTVGYDPYSVVTGDLDGDGKPDIATSNRNDNSLSILRNQSTPANISFAAAVPLYTNLVVQAFSNRIAIADMDGDGKLDLARLNFLTPGTATLFKNLSTPGNLRFSLTRDARGLDVLLGDRPVSVVMQDFDGDGRPDMASINTFNNPGVSVARNQSGEEPFIFSFSPTSGINTTTITITGKNFDGATNVAFNGVPAGSFTVVSPTTITTLPPQNTSGVISVTTPKGTATLDGFVYAAPPVISGAVPVNATTGNTVTLTGSNFLGATDVSFGGLPAASFTVVDPYTIRAVVAAGATGAFGITTSYGTGTMAGFTYLPVPTITSFTPPVGIPGTVVTLTGTNFTGVSDVEFGGVKAASFTVLSPTSITAVVGAGASGNVTVTNDGWTNYLAGFLFDPTVKVTSDGPLTFCQGGSLVLRSSLSVGNQWYKNEVPIPGATGDSLLVMEAGTYLDKPVFPGLTIPASQPFTVIVNPIPSKPTITPAPGGALISSAATGNQWYRDTLTLIQGANGQLYFPADSGFFAVKVTTSGCPGAFSDGYFYHLPVKPQDTTSSGTVQVGPNPIIAGRTQVTYNFPGAPLLDVQVVDVYGHTVLFQPDFASGGFLDLSRWPKGLFILRLLDSTGKRYASVSIMKL